MIDFTEYDDEALADLRIQVLTELERRQTIATAEAQAEQIAARYAQAIGREDGDEWAAPTGAHDAYPKGAVVTHNGKKWESLTGANVWEPGISGWREVAEPDPETGEPGVPDYIPPSGAHDAYKTGDRVTFDGAVWESVIDGNVWSPKDYPQGWKKITEGQ